MIMFIVILPRSALQYMKRSLLPRFWNPDRTGRSDWELDWNLVF